MILVPALAGRTVAVMGLGKSGTATARALAAAGASVWVWDDNEAARAQATACGLTVVDLAAAPLDGLAALVWSPGIPHTLPRPHAVALRARAAGLALVCDVELLRQALPQTPAIAITGTNGKSTTTTLIAHILAQSGRPTAVGGNLGTPALDLAPLGDDGAYVLELSSYQIELLHAARFDVGVLLNVTPDHLGRHGGLAGYGAVKAHLFDLLTAPATAVVGVDDPHCRAIFDRVRHRAGDYAVPISAERAVAGGVSAPEGVLVDDTAGRARAVLDLTQIATLPGRHNWQNACAAFAATRALGVAEAAILAGLRSYPGLAHRQQTVAVIDGVAYVNDSKATNADAAEKALVCYDAIYWIIGGQAKEGGIASLERHFPRVRHAFLVGEAADDFAATLAGRVAFTHCGTLDVAVAQARALAVAEGRPGSAVLLSPACASWDQFTSFEHRGDVFAGLVRALPGVRAP